MAASGAGSDPVNVENLFKTHLYTGTGSAITITNGIDLSGQGGLVWFAKRFDSNKKIMVDTVRGNTKILKSAADHAEDTSSDQITAFNSDGFSVGTNDDVGANNADYVTWTFRKSPKFFDIVTYTGNGTAGRTISHNLGTTVGSVWIKKRNGSTFWMVYHKGAHSSNPEYYHLSLNANFSITDLGQSQSNPSNMWNQTAPTSTQITLGSDSNVNANGDTYVAYVFAHNNSDGEFGVNADQDVIKCGSYTGNGSSSGQDVDLGFEPQFVLYKCVTQTQDWRLVDSMRGVPFAGTISSTFNHQYLRPNLSAQENDDDDIEFYANGFRPKTSGQQVNGGSETYVYIAIRRGPMATPQSSSSCFDIETRGATLPNPPAFNTSFDVDFAWRGVPGGTFVVTRNTQGVAAQTLGYFNLDSANARTTNNNGYVLDFTNGWMDNSSVSTSDYGYSWGRAPGFFDMTAYKGNTTARTIPHNLGVVPEMIWIKKYNSSGDWFVYHSGLSSNSHMIVVNSGDAESNEGNKFWNSTTPTSSVFSIGSHAHPNANNDLYLALLWSTLSGVSKVGSFTGNGGSQNIDCGFSNGAKFVIIKAASTSGGWQMWDTARGIVSGNDTSFVLNDNSGLTGDAIDPLSSGFTVNNTGNITNSSDITYIFYAIAT